MSQTSNGPEKHGTTEPSGGQSQPGRTRFSTQWQAPPQSEQRVTSNVSIDWDKLKADVARHQADGMKAHTFTDVSWNRGPSAIERMHFYLMIVDPDKAAGTGITLAPVSLDELQAFLTVLGYKVSYDGQVRPDDGPKLGGLT